MRKAPENLYIVVPAGGVGTRLWPRSRIATPKQFLLLAQKTSITQETFKRLKGFAPYERIFIIAHDRYKQQFFRQLPEFLPENYISEPERKGTSGAIGLAALSVSKKDPQGVIHFLVCDDYIKDASRFLKTIGVAAEVASKEGIFVVYGVKPSYPATGYGYIQVEKASKKVDGVPVFKVKRFVEKPDVKTAEKFLKEGDYFWHGSGFTARCDVLLSEMKERWPVGFERLDQISKLSSLPADFEEGKIAGIYHGIENIPIEYSILEKVDKIAMLRLEDSWKDIAGWKTIYDISSKDKDGNVVIRGGNKGQFIGLDAKNNLIHFDDQLIAAIGVKDLVIVDTSDAVLICKRDRAEDVKKVVNLLKEKGKKEYL